MIGPCFISSKSLTAGAVLLAADAVLKALKHVWVSLEPLHAPMAVMGGLSEEKRDRYDIDKMGSFGLWFGDATNSAGRSW